MPAYLLGTQALVDSARNDNATAIHRWAAAEALDEDDVVCSVASMTLFKYKVEQLDASERPSWQRLFNASLARFRAAQSIRPIELDVALRAADLRSMALETVASNHAQRLGDLGCLVAATALEEHLVLVDRRQPYHRVLEEEQGLAFCDPYKT